jgi:hypothetical protein
MATFLFKSAAFALIFLLALEVYSIFLPATTFPPVVRDRHFGFDRMDPNVQFTGTFTFGRLAQIRADWHINDEGWNSRRQYTIPPDSSRFLVTLSGDSYVNSLYHEDHTQITGFLKQYLPSTTEVYGFGMPGTNIADYWRFSCYYKQFRPSVCLYLINSGDVTGALAEMGRNPKASQIQINESEIRFIERNPDPLEPIKKNLRRSKAWTFLNQNFDLTNEAIAVARKLASLASLPLRKRASDSEAAPNFAEISTTRLIEAIISQNPDARHVFLLHPNRELIYRSGGKDFSLVPDLECLETLLSTVPKAEVLNLSPIFASDYRKHSQKFEFEINRHFDAYGNSVVARAIADYLSLAESPSK